MKLRSPWLIRIIAHLGALVVRTWLGTVRARTVSLDERIHPTDPRAERFIYAFWHESLLAPTKMKANVQILVSQSADGELITQICQHLGFGVVRGSTSRGGAAGLLSLVRAAGDSHLVLTPDGPRGPRRRLKSGIVFLASQTGLRIVPVGVGYTRAWRAKSWDRFALPRPFSTVTGVIGTPIAVPPQLDEQAIEDYRYRVEAAMLSATAAAEESAARLVTPTASAASPPSIEHDAARAWRPVPHSTQVTTSVGDVPALK